MTARPGWADLQPGRFLSDNASQFETHFAAIRHGRTLPGASVRAGDSLVIE